MADSFVQVPQDSTGKKIDTSVIVVGSESVERQRMVIGSPTAPGRLAFVKNAKPSSSDTGLVVWIAKETDTASVVNMSTSALAVDASVNIDSADLGGSTRCIRGADITGTGSMKVEVKKVVDGVETILATFFAFALEFNQWRVADEVFFEETFSSNTGFDGFRFTLTHKPLTPKDTGDPADVETNMYICS